MSKKVKKTQENFVWLSYSDLATGLMISFILIFIVMDKKNTDFMKDAIEPVVDARRAFNKVNELVIKLIKRKKVCNGAVITSRPGQPETIQIMYKEGWKNSWFKSGSFELQSHAKKCLYSFGKIWLSEMYKENSKQSVQIKNLIIEGHTNSLARAKVRGKGNEANFLDNLELSQQRAFETTKYILKVTPSNGLGLPQKFDKWKRKRLSANGRSYSDRVFKKNKREDFANSKRVEFKYTLQHNYDSYGEIKRRYSKN